MENKISKPVKDFIEYLETKNIKNVNICLHDTPDPDAIGSGLGMKLILNSKGIDSKIIYAGDVSHPQNKTMINVLNIVMEKVNSKIDGVNICVDGTPNNSCANSAELIIDHHKNPAQSTFQIINPIYGSCSTIIWEIIKELEIPITVDSVNTFTALLLGIRTDTNDLISENMSEMDFKAYQELLIESEKESIQKIMNYPLPKYLYDKRLVLHDEGNYYETNGIFVGGVGNIQSSQRDVIAVLAEEYARMESVNTAIIFAIVDKKKLQISIRSSNVSLDVGQMCRDLFSNYGGGTSYKGGANIPLNFYEDLEGNEKDIFWKITCKHMFRKILKESWKDDDTEVIVKKKEE